MHRILLQINFLFNHQNWKISLWKRENYQNGNLVNKKRNNIIKCGTTNWRFEVLLKIVLKDNTIRCKKLISALVLTCFRLKKGRATFFRPKTIVACFLHLMMLFLIVIFNHVHLIFHLTSKLFSYCNYCILFNLLCERNN